MENNIKVGDKVNYHSFSGGEITSNDHKVTDIVLMPNNFGEDVAWISGKSGCVSISHLSKQD